MGDYDKAWKNVMDAHRIQRKLTEKRSGVSIAVSKQPFSITDLDKLMDQALMGGSTVTGLNINAETANSCVAYFAGKRLIAETVGQLPLIEYKRLPRGKDRATDRIVYRLLHDEPNPEMDAMAFKESRMDSAIGWGNAFAEIEWNMDDGYPVALWPLTTANMKVGRDVNTGELLYIYRLPDGTVVKLPAYRVWHLKGYSPDGILGYDTVFLMREAIALAMSMQEYGARFFGNGANPGGVLEHPNHLSTASQENLRKSWNEMHQGLSNAHRIAILEEGMKYQQVGIPPENAQFLESRKFQLNEVARLLHIPPHMLADLDRATFSNIEHQGIEYVTYTMLPWLKRWEQTCTRKLIMPWERKTYFVEFLVDALLRGDSAARSAYYASRQLNGSMTINDVREAENENPIDDPNADKAFVQANMIPIDKAGKQQPVQAPAPDKSAIDETVKKIADRDRNNILKGYRKDPAKFESWTEDYFRDFPEYINRELSTVLGNGHKE
jgi:HK97 family phage portal protein